FDHADPERNRGHRRRERGTKQRRQSGGGARDGARGGMVADRVRGLTARWQRPGVRSGRAPLGGGFLGRWPAAALPAAVDEFEEPFLTEFSLADDGLDAALQALAVRAGQFLRGVDQDRDRRGGSVAA